MRYIKNYKLFENKNINDIDPSVIDEYLIDFIHMGMESDIKVSSCYVLDFAKLRFKKAGDMRSTLYIGSSDIDNFNKGVSIGLTITLDRNDSGTGRFKMIEYNIDEVEDSYHMLSSFLNSEYGLNPNYIMISHGKYFEDFDDIREALDGVVVSGGFKFGGILPSSSPGTFKANQIVFGFVL